jgi:hypothetical protein
MSEGKAVQDRPGGRGITHPEGGGSRLGSGAAAKDGETRQGALSRPVLDGLGRHASNDKKANVIGHPLPGARA